MAAKLTVTTHGKSCTSLGHATMLGSAAAAIREASDILAAARLTSAQ